ncbi:tRNA (adenosine(37)-N6)-threonylcarbamoyltransferase complex dimerization subunit type 1 TsaB [Bradyrhizobium sp. 147]|uniref:tRNA (adenosine(37)-N6)-threonylcarbamoyltransferase complex dimerization subunit type 1 TsaB n=1 Tax=unclassified Bradyrhizobium TaxID=2631580 RepID=UPI001FFA3E4F|nr:MULTISPECIES: tRNA (adenosine(37)-N6)-threonylcarbamoyltransferase complex dimerization subunit type 1 TsaB [unclassified Bradyrhizobium]MCK1545546.1 tRNA (adenosine(37)-N6)-threonylcarbamoyltransferase complex dimerization subunit type 1 TsaB [Bradyrhizobium sp. 179]MCK1623588.1 tRNA (adenosine(37)-N6)-threonylcarbamoyltransferase complex dimerization subunit type 1 TsaB [Bradyrhizobium sp. 160]MCK1681343.1 tRNA (adenosine(37)-N6)-threonylcarbamoyltransferase complex dimerization subunit typ
MLILAIDTALDACAAAVLDTETAELRAQESVPMKRGHAEALMPLIARVMKSAELSFTALDRIAVTVGPGSFTGLRVGISAARGFALAAKRPAIGLTTLSAYAAAVVGQNRSAPVISAIDARHAHVYFQIVAGDGSQLVRPRVAGIDEAIAASQFGAPHLVGNAANILAERWPKDAPQPVAVDAQAAPDIAWVAWLGAAANPDATPARPFYLRAPDAKPAAQPQLAAKAATS